MKEVFHVINDLVATRVIDDYAIGGAIGATFYVEPFATTDVDIFFPLSLETNGLVSLEPLYKELKSRGYTPIGDGVEIEGWHVQFLPAFDELTAQAITNANSFEVDGEPVRVMSPEYLIAIALNTKRPKDFARVKMFKDLDIVNKDLLFKLIKQFDLEVQWQRYRALI